MSDYEPTPETLVWIYKNAEQAWQEGDPKQLQYWEDQKKEFYKKCYQRIDSLVKQSALLQQQQQALIEKVKRGEYSPEEANQINQQIYGHREEIKKRIQFYRELIEYPAEASISPESANHQTSSHKGTQEQSIPYQRVIPIERFFYEVFISILRAIFLSNPGQITICMIILVTAVYFTWTWNTQNQQPHFEYTYNSSDNKHIIQIHNPSLFNTKIYLTPKREWNFIHYIYTLECSAEKTASQDKTIVSVPLNCFYIEEGIQSPMTLSYLEIPPGSQKNLSIDTQCLKQNLPDIQTLSITIYQPFPHKPIFKTDIILNKENTEDSE